jgi:hypothetical protein
MQHCITSVSKQINKNKIIIITIIIFVLRHHLLLVYFCVATTVVVVVVVIIYYLVCEAIGTAATPGLATTVTSLSLISQAHIRYRRFHKFNLLATMSFHPTAKLKLFPISLNDTELFIEEFYKIRVIRDSFHRFPGNITEFLDSMDHNLGTTKFYYC